MPEEPKMLRLVPSLVVELTTNPLHTAPPAVPLARVGTTLTQTREEGRSLHATGVFVRPQAICEPLKRVILRSHDGTDACGATGVLSPHDSAALDREADRRPAGRREH